MAPTPTSRSREPAIPGSSSPKATNAYGFAFTSCTLNASAGSNPVCVQTGSTFTAVSQFNACTFGGSPASAVRFNDYSTGRLTFQNCTFQQWGTQPGSAAIVCPGGSVAVLGSEFQQDRDQVVLGAGVTNAQILDNVYPAGPRIVNGSRGEVLVSQPGYDKVASEVGAAPREPVKLKGKAKPVPLWEIRRAKVLATEAA